MDLAHFLIGDFSSVLAINSKISSLQINADDISEMIVKHKKMVLSVQFIQIF